MNQNMNQDTNQNINQDVNRNSNRHKSTMQRDKLSAPVRLALESGFITKNMSILDYGCGHGDDVQRLQERGFSVTGYDPYYFPDSVLTSADVVILCYVLDIIEDVTEREWVLSHAFELANYGLLVASSVNYQRRGDISFGDGTINSWGVFHCDWNESGFRAFTERVLLKMGIPIAGMRGALFILKDSPF